MDFLNASFHTITLKYPMRVTRDDGLFSMTKILTASSLRGDGETLSITLIEIEDQSNTKLYPCKAGVAVPLSNIAGWQTEMRKR